ncbi:MAG: hypothetical protein JWM68_394 [Verrucomicrobiales bacterium]|nr:hypothetical protein [Verrucomicrobiales bacterium]
MKLKSSRVVNHKSSVASKLRSLHQGKAALSSMHPHLTQIFESVIEPIWALHSSNIDEFLNLIVSKMYCVTTRDVFFTLMSAFGNAYQIRIHRAGLLARWLRQNNKYLAGLCPEEIDAYKEMDSKEEDAFRICRDLALSSKTPRRFFLSANALAARMNLKSDMQAYRIIQEFVNVNILRIKKRGCKRAQKRRGRATVYAYILPAK